MVWYKRHRRIWSVTLLALLIFAFIGPWAYDRIHVPAEYPCTPPNVRLEGDFCGVPVAGWWIFSAVAGLIATVALAITDPATLAERARDIIAALLLLLLLLPIFSTLLMLWRREGRDWRVFHVLSWGLPAAAILWWLVAIFPSGTPLLQLWGLWLYVGLVIVVLLLELVGLTTRGRFGRSG
jgi:hypothetical protein